MDRNRAMIWAVAFSFAAWPLPARGQPTESELRLPSFDRLAELPHQPESTLPPGEDTLTLAEVEERAVANYPALRVAEAEVRAARGRWLQAGLYPNPVLGYAGDEIGNDGLAGMQGGFISQEFVTAGKLRLSRAAAAREVAAAEQRYFRARLQILTAARTYYFQALAADRVVTLARELETIADQAVSASEQRLRADDISRAALLQTQIESDAADLLEVQAVNQYDAAQRRLATILGLDLATRPLPRLEDGFGRPLPPLDWESSRARLLSESPELAEAQFAVEAARWAVDRETARRVPNVGVEAGVQFDHTTRDTVANVQIGVPLPIFDRNQGGIAAAYAELSAAQGALERQQLVVEQRLASVLRDYLTARQRVERYANSILPATSQSLEMFRQAYQQGELDYLQLISAQRIYTEKHLDYLRDLEMAWQKWAEIEGLLVEPLPEVRD